MTFRPVSSSSRDPAVPPRSFFERSGSGDVFISDILPRLDRKDHAALRATSSHLKDLVDKHGRPHVLRAGLGVAKLPAAPAGEQPDAWLDGAVDAHRAAYAKGRLALARSNLFSNA